MLEYSLRFLAGGIAVSAFAAFGDTLRPKSFAGLFGAAPSIALATLLITLSQKGAPFVASVRVAQKILAVLVDCPAVKSKREGPHDHHRATF